MNIKAWGYGLITLELALVLVIVPLISLNLQGALWGWGLSTATLLWALPSLTKKNTDFQTFILKVLGQGMARGALVIASVTIVGYYFRPLAIPFAGALVGCYMLNLGFEVLLVILNARKDTQGNT